MTKHIEKFRKQCEDAAIKPTEALMRAGVHPSLWGKWVNGVVSPRLTTFEKAQDGLAALKRERSK